MERNEPTTGEIVRALRDTEDPNILDWVDDAADRLESQERELSEKTEQLEKFKAFHERYAEQTSKKYVEDICALTARAESAEAERDAAIADMEGYCQFCAWYECEETDPPCNTCFNTRTFESDDINRAKNWKYRGLRDGKERV